MVENFINNLTITDMEKHFAKRVFNESKNSRYTVEDLATKRFLEIQEAYEKIRKERQF